MVKNTGNMKENKQPDIYRQALEKARALCGRQEKCRSDMQKKLLGWGLDGEKTLQALAQLEKEGFIDDGRYATAFALDKHRLNRWGRLKIRQALKAKKIPSSLIDQALAALPGDDYAVQVRQALEKKLPAIRARNRIELKAKLFRYAAGKGYEPSLVYTIIDELLTGR